MKDENERELSPHGLLPVVSLELFPLPGSSVFFSSESRQARKAAKDKGNALMDRVKLGM